MISKRSTIRHISHSLYYQGAPVSVVKLHLAHLAWHDVTLCDLEAAIPDLKFLVLYRSSLAEQFVSREIVKETRAFADRSGQAEQVRSLRIDVSGFVEFAEKIRDDFARAINAVSEKSQMCLVSYEELANDPAAVFDSKICPFLDIEPVVLTTSLRKQNRKSLRELVENFEELEPYLDEYTLHLNWECTAPHVGVV